MNKKVSVIIPAFNRARYIKRAIESVWNQQYEPLELIVVDDGSIDDTPTVVKELQRTKELFFFENQFNKGPSGARNTGLVKSSGGYIAFLDSDDVWLDGHLRNAVTILQTYDVDVLFGNFRLVNAAGESMGNFFSEKKVLHTLLTVGLDAGTRRIVEDPFCALIQESFFHVGSSVTRREAVEGILFDDTVRFAEDKDFAIRLCKEKKAKFAYRTDPVFIMSRHAENLNSDSIESNQARMEDQIKLLQKYLAMYDLNKSEKALLFRIIARHFINLSYLHRYRGQYWNAFTHLIDSGKYDLFLSQSQELAKIVYRSLQASILAARRHRLLGSTVFASGEKQCESPR